ncbi:MAG TPA: hypothetical protein VN600_15325 [Gemmatimonadaceae bacterium]|nr:hypothetical protein [Gemmatimonadaceae bacterium]
MMRKTLGLVAAAAFVATSVAGAQKGGTPSFGLGYTDIGPTVGLGGINGASASFGGRFEHAIKALPDMGNGILGIQVAAEYYSWSATGFGFSSSVKYLPIGVTANYHFKVESEPKFDPFIGLGLGYDIVSCSVSSGNFNGDCGYNSALYFIGRAGARYFFAPNMAGYADVGAGGATLNIGLMFKLH